MNDRERFHATMRYESKDRHVFAKPWLGFPETLERWEREGMQSGDIDRWNTDQWHWIGHWFFPHPPFEHEVLEDDGRHILYVNHEGILMRELKVNRLGSMPQFVRFPVETVEDFRKFAKERLQPDVGARIGGDWVKTLKDLRAQPATFFCIADRWGGFFGPLRNLMGVENLCMAFYTEPALVEEMMDTIADFVIAQVGVILDHIELDVFGLWEDMAYNHGPLIGPDHVRQFMLPRYKRVVEYVKSRGVPWVCLDSDGQVDSLIPIWVDAGIDLLYPFEVAAGMDVVAVRREYGKDLRLYGGLDKRPLVEGPKAIDKEIERILPLLEDGGYIPNIDHSIPPDVSWSHMSYFVEKMHEVLGMT